MKQEESANELILFFQAELSESLQHLSERAKSAHAHITTLKNYQDRVNVRFRDISSYN